MIGSERGYSLVEMLVVMAILGVVIAGLTTIFVSGSNAELDLNRRFVAQQQARLALDELRNDLHCASAAEVDSTYKYLKIKESNCSATDVTWCTMASTQLAGRYGLYRTTDTTTNRCTSADTSKTLVADYLTSPMTSSTKPLWTFNAPDGALEMISVDLPVSTNPSSSSRDLYELKDIVVARNSVRCSGTCTQGAYPVSP